MDTKKAICCIIQNGTSCQKVCGTYDLCPIGNDLVYICSEHKNLTNDSLAMFLSSNKYDSTNEKLKNKFKNVISSVCNNVYDSIKIALNERDKKIKKLEISNKILIKKLDDMEKNFEAMYEDMNDRINYLQDERKKELEERDRKKDQLQNLIEF
jgi:hypothetical protein